MLKLRILFTLLCLSWLMPAQALEFHTADSTGVTVPAARDLAEDGVLAREKNLPIMLIVSSDYCSFCILLEREILKPMIISREYENKVIMRMLNISSYRDIRNFRGELVSPADYASKYGVMVTPTILFLDHQGRELAGRMVGINTVEFYGGRVDSAIEESLQRLRRSANHVRLQRSAP